MPGTGCRQVRGRFDGNFIRTCGTYPEEIGYTIAGSGCGGPNITCASSTARYSPSTGTLVADCTVDLTSRQSRADVFFWVTIGGRRYLRRTPFQVTCRE